MYYPSNLVANAGIFLGQTSNIADFTLVRLYLSVDLLWLHATLRDWHKSVVASECCTSPD